MGPVRPVVLVFDPVRDAGWSYDREAAYLAGAGASLVVPADDEAARELSRTADVVVVTFPTFGPREMGCLERCVGLVAYSAGMDMIDLEAADRLGLPVTNIAGYCTDEVSDHALALVLAVERRLPFFWATAAAGEWIVHGRPEFAELRRLRGRTLGVLGAGRVGREVARKARAFGLRSVAADPCLAGTGDPDLPLVSREELLASSDIVVVCAALTPGSRGSLDASAFARMRPGSTLVNVSRGGLIDEAALLDALRSGQVGFAALDVRAQEPPPADDPLRSLPNVLLTQHVAFASIESDEDLRRGAADAAIRLLVAAGRLSAG